MSKTNFVQLIGNLGQKPELITTAGNKILCSFSMATHDHSKDEHGNKVTRTEWHNVVAFDNIATLLHKFTDRGARVMIQGRLHTRQYVDKQNNNRYSTEIVVEEVLFLDANKQDTPTA